MSFWASSSFNLRISSCCLKNILRSWGGARGAGREQVRRTWEHQGSQTSRPTQACPARSPSACLLPPWDSQPSAPYNCAPGSSLQSSYLPWKRDEKAHLAKQTCPREASFCHPKLAP